MGVVLALVIFFKKTNHIEIDLANNSGLDKTVSLAAEALEAASAPDAKAAPKMTDIENQKPLADPPTKIKAVYLTSWSAGNSAKINYLIDLARDTEINAVVIDIKDYSGFVAYDIQVPEVKKYQAQEIRIPFVNRLIKQLHDEGIYVIARITVFQDPRLVQARPDLAVKSKKTNKIWLDNKKLSWLDPDGQETWNYIIAIAKEAANRGFDELNFDYIRFPSDGEMNDLVFPFGDGQTSKEQTIKNFFQTLRRELNGIKISADLFGLTTVNQDDLGIGQVIEDAYENFDFVAPMIYPSHYAAGFLNYKNPAQYPYEVVKYSIEKALARLIPSVKIGNEIATTTAVAIAQPKEPIIFKAKLRPWLQDFDLGADYNAAMVKKQMQAVADSLQICSSTCAEAVSGWMLWNPSNNYTKGALELVE